MIRPLVSIGALIVLSAVEARYEDGGRESYEHEDHYSYGPSYESHYAYHDNRPHHYSYEDYHGSDAYSVEPSYTYEPKSRPTYKQPHEPRYKRSANEMGVGEEQVLVPLGNEREGMQRRMLRRIQSIVTQTGRQPNADTNSEIKFSISGEAVSGSDECKCQAQLNDIPRDDFTNGALDVFGKNVLSVNGDSRDCFNKICNGRPIVTLENKGSDGWFVEWVEINFDDGTSCTSRSKIDRIGWLDDPRKQDPITCCNKKWTGALC